jgi:hypothetical protein
MEQNRIGWKHIFYGRISTCMITAMEDHYHTLNINTKQYSGERWAKKFIINIWTTILKLWKTRNDIIYDSENKQHLESLRDKLKSRVLRCYVLQDQLLANDRRLWFDTTLQDKLEEDPKQIQTWLSLVERIIRISKREQNKRPKYSRIMDRFLGLRQQPPTLHTMVDSINNPRAYQQDLHPD